MQKTIFIEILMKSKGARVKNGHFRGWNEESQGFSSPGCAFMTLRGAVKDTTK